MVLVRRFPAEPWAVSAARRLVQMATADMPEGVAGDADLIVSELMTNAVRHGAGPVEVRLRSRTGEPFGIEVLDQGPGFEPEIPPGPASVDATAGRGLHVVDQLADRWGISPRGGTWAELRTRDKHRHHAGLQPQVQGPE